VIELTKKNTEASTDGLQLAYWTHTSCNSDGKCLLLVHGGASNHTRWSEFAALSKLNQNWNIIAPDMRGNGSSMTRRQVDIPTWCADLHDILNAEKAKTIVIVGHSLGAQIAIHFVDRYPEKVQGLALIDTVFQSSLQGKSLWVHHHPKLIRAAVSIILFFNALGLRRRNFITPDLRELDKETRKALQGADSFEEIAQRYSALGPILRHMPMANYLRQALATVGPMPPLETINAPVLALLSSGTTVGSLERNMREVGRFKNSDIVSLNANHWPLTETPESVRSAIADWVSSKW